MKAGVGPGDETNESWGGAWGRGYALKKAWVGPGDNLGGSWGVERAMSHQHGYVRTGVLGSDVLGDEGVPRLVNRGQRPAE